MEEGHPASITSYELFSGKSVALFGMPGAFTPACHHTHLPSIVTEYESLKSNSVDIVACTAVNDVFVMDAWRCELDIPHGILLLADDNGDFSRGIGLSFDGRSLGLGERSKRYAMWVKNSSIQHLTVDPDPTVADVSSAYALPRVFESWSGGVDSTPA